MQSAIANTASSNSQKGATRARTLKKPQEELTQSKDVSSPVQPAQPVQPNSQQSGGSDSSRPAPVTWQEDSPGATLVQHVCLFDTHPALQYMLQPWQVRAGSRLLHAKLLAVLSQRLSLGLIGTTSFWRLLTSWETCCSLKPADPICFAFEFMKLSSVPADAAVGGNGNAATGDNKASSNSPSQGDQPSTEVKEASSTGNSSHSKKGQHAGAMQEGPAGNSPGAAGVANLESGISKTTGDEAEGRDADDGHQHAAQAAETGTAQGGTATADAGAGKKHNKGRKKKKGK